jgi:hypothetical protein
MPAARRQSDVIQRAIVDSARHELTVSVLALGFCLAEADILGVGRYRA